MAYAGAGDCTIVDKSHTTHIKIHRGQSRQDERNSGRYYYAGTYTTRSTKLLLKTVKVNKTAD